MFDNRPQIVLMLGCLAMAVAGLGLASSLTGAISYTLSAPNLSEAGVPSSAMRWYEASLVVQLVMSGLGIWAGWAFLQCRAWARTALEGLGWTSLVVVLGLAVYVDALWLSMMAGRASVSLSDYLPFAGGVFVQLTLAAVPGAFIYFLRGDEVHRAMRYDGGEAST